MNYQQARNQILNTRAQAAAAGDGTAVTLCTLMLKALDDLNRALTQCVTMWDSVQNQRRKNEW